MTGVNLSAGRDQLTAAAIGDLDWLQVNLRGANPQLKTDHHGFTAVHLSALHSQLPCIKLLVEDYKVDINLSSHDGWTPLHLVLNKKNGSRVIGCVRYLIQQGANVNVASKSGLTPLHQAASEGLQDCIMALVEAGADVHAKDRQGQKPIDFCKTGSHRACGRYLLNAMWKKDKEDFALEMKKMEKLKKNLQKTEHALCLRMQEERKHIQHLHFCDWIDEKGLPDRLKKQSHCQKEVSAKPKNVYDHSTKSTDEQKFPKYRPKKVLPSSKPPTIVPTRGGASVTKMCHCKEEIASQNDTEMKNLQHKKEPKSWNPCVNTERPPATEICRPSTNRLGTHPEEATMHDFSSYVLLSKDLHGHPKIETVDGKVTSQVPNLPYEVIQRSLFPNSSPPERLHRPQDFKPTHVLDVPKKQPLSIGHKPVSEIAFHLRQNLDSK